MEVVKEKKAIRAAHPAREEKQHLEEARAAVAAQQVYCFLILVLRRSPSFVVQIA